MTLRKPITIVCVSSSFRGNRFIESCKKEGCTTILLTVDKTLDSPWSREYLDEVFALPNFDDWTTVVKALSDLARTRPIDRLCAFDDYDVDLVAHLREHIRVPGMDESTSRYFRDKLAMRTRAARTGIPIPRFVHILNHERIRQFLRDVPPPWMLKPRRAASSRGIMKCKHPDQVWQRIERLGDQQSNFLLEQMIAGDVYHVDAIVSEGELLFAEPHRYWRPLFEVAQQGGILSTRTAPRDDPATHKLLALNQELLRKFEFVRGVAHTEYIRSAADGEFYFLETAARVGGGDIGELVEASTGINLWSEWAKIEIAQGEWPYEAPRPTRRDYSALIGSRAIQEAPDTSSYNDPEICWRLRRKSHVGFVLRSSSWQRIDELIASYLPRIKKDFFYKTGIVKSPLGDRKREEIERIVSVVSGGVGNVEDVYPLAPLQEEILFHHLLANKGDVSSHVFRFDSRTSLNAFVAALKAVIGRHDILRTGVQWEGLSEPVQIVWRRARLPVEEVVLDPAAGEIADQLYARFNPRHYAFDVRQAPLLRAYIAREVPTDRWLCLILLHHLAGNHAMLQLIADEVEAHLVGRADELPAPQPFRDFVAQARIGMSQKEHEEFFRKLLGDVDEPTAPFGLMDAQVDGRGTEEARVEVDATLAERLREHARKLGVSEESLCHVAWAQVLARTTGREDVVFGTVLGRMRLGFINTLPVRIHVGEEGVEATVRLTHTLLSELMQHQFASLALVQRCSGLPAPTPLFSALLNYRHNPTGNREICDDDVMGYPLALSVDDLPSGFTLTAHVQAPVEPRRVCDLMHTALERLVDALTATPDAPLRSLDVLPESERRRVLEEWNATETEYASEQCIHELFEAQVRKSPDAVAVVHDDAEMTYGELNVRANQLAHYLRELGVKPDERVAICVERGFEMIVGMLAVLKAGGAYVPLSSIAYRSRWIRRIEASGIRAVLTRRTLTGLFKGVSGRLPVLDLTTDVPPWASQPATNPDRSVVGLTPDHLAYVIYTSGSTGIPKAVMVEHRGLCNLVAAQIRGGFAVQPESRILQSASFSFDACIFEVVMALCNGAALYIPPQEAIPPQETLRQAVDRYRVTHATVSPAVLAALGEQTDLQSVHTMIVAGDILSDTLAKRWGRGRRLINAYGPTETTVWATQHDCRVDEPSAPPIGRPIANFRIYILCARGLPVPIGVTGEIYIGGVGVARGYLNQPKLTAERFIRDPFSSEPGARMYKTGDLGKWLPDGSIEFLGRNDFQVKVRGFRIELGDIEARLVEHPGVREAVVLARQDDPGDERLVAYYTAELTNEEGKTEVGTDALRTLLSRSLPEYMVPAAFVRMERLPLTPNGKLDRKALPAPEADAFPVRRYEAPEGDVETTMAGIWSDVLKVKRVGRHDNFFELGGQYISTMEVVRLLKDADIEISVSDLFLHATVESLATSVAGHMKRI